MLFGFVNYFRFIGFSENVCHSFHTLFIHFSDDADRRFVRKEP